MFLLSCHWVLSTAVSYRNESSSIIGMESPPLLRSHRVLRSWLIYYHTCFAFDRISVEFTTTTPENLFSWNLLDRNEAFITADFTFERTGSSFLTGRPTVITLCGFVVSCRSVTEPYLSGYRALPPTVLAES